MFVFRTIPFIAISFMFLFLLATLPSFSSYVIVLSNPTFQADTLPHLSTYIVYTQILLQSCNSLYVSVELPVTNLQWHSIYVKLFCPLSLYPWQRNDIRSIRTQAHPSFTFSLLPLILKHNLWQETNQQITISWFSTFLWSYALK